jgi:hypothetical protein
MMAHRETCSEDLDAHAATEEFKRLLNEALELADRMELPPEIGARLQEVIDLAQTCLGDSPQT